MAVPVVLALALFANTISGEFVYDDNAIVRDNPTIRDLGKAGELFTSTYWQHTGRNSGLYRPGTILTYALNYAVGGLNPSGYHAVNVVLHAMTTLLVALLIWHLAGSATVGSVAGILFAVHPIHVEAVANVVGRAELLSAFFVLLALLLYAGASRSEGRPRFALLSASVVSYGVGLFCKENAVTFMVLPVAYDVVYRRAYRRVLSVVQSQWKAYLAFALVTAVYLGIRAAVVGGLLISDIPSPDNPLVDATAGQRLLTPFAVAARYLWLMFWPVNLSADYGVNAFPVVRSVFDPRFVLGVLSACILGVGLVRAYSRSRAVAFLIVFGLCTYAIASNTVVLIGAIVAERLFYLVSAGLCGLAAIGLAAIARRAPESHRGYRLAIWAAALVIAVPLTARTFWRNRDWHSEFSLFTKDVRKFPQSAKLNFNAGLVLIKDKQAAESIPYFETCIRIRPRSERALIHLGKAYGALGNNAKRREIYQRAVELFGETEHTLPAVAFLHMEAGEYDAARLAYEEALREDPHNDQSRVNLGLALYNLERYREAAEQLEETDVTPEPELERQRALYFALSLYKLKQYDQALKALRKGINAFPEDSEFSFHEQFILGQQAMFRKDYEKAISHLEAAATVSPDARTATHLLGLAHYNLGHYEKAVEIFQKTPGATPRLIRERAIALGTSLTKLSRFEQAADVYREALPAADTNTDILERVAFIEYTHLKDFPSALAHYEALLAAAPDHPRQAEFRRVAAYLRRRAPEKGSTD
jgi:tetratricopeptide (TPR) repeat protein